MSSVRTPRSVFYDGDVYGRLVEPLLGGVHGYVVKHLPAGDSVLEACCGTGGLARRIAARGRRVVGVDLSPKNVAFARSRSKGTEPERLRFEVGDVSQLEPPELGRYDVATIVLALHEMPTAARVAVLSTLLRVARKVMVVDFAVPMPRNLAGARNRFMELAAGPTHFAAFRDFVRRDGLHGLARKTGAIIESQRRIDAGTLQCMILRDA